MAQCYLKIAKRKVFDVFASQIFNMIGQVRDKQVKL